MPDGACVIRYEGKRGSVWRLKYRDATGRQVQETLGRGDEGWSKRRAEAELRARLTAVHRDGYRKVEPVTFGSYQAEWLDTYPAAKALKRSTIEGYRLIIEKHLVPAFGSAKLDSIDGQALDAYLVTKRREGLAPRTLNRHLNLLSAILKAAERRSLIRANPVPSVDRPREPRRRWRILSPAEVGSVERAFEELIDEAEGEERDWRRQARAVFLVLVAAGLRRGEVLGLRWHSVHLADPDGAFLRVCETFVRGGIDTPKSEAGERTIALGNRVSTELFEHRARTAFAGEDERVFGSPTKGTPFDTARYAATFRLALARAGIADYVRPFHDLRHSSITNAAAAGTPPAALMARAGHSDFKT
ncbi:MAG: site-specific integrase, partial [Pyrinomonadaceae bacterium]|nr:site-specific integrase [Pyrinomonadaceae bacterium]